MQQQDIMVLVDSGSSHTFISDKLRPMLSGVEPLVNPITVQLAIRQVIPCHYHLPSAKWSMSGCHFSADLKFLPIPSFGQAITCNYQVPSAEWTMHVRSFSVDLTFLLLPLFDLVEGMDRLQRYSPMPVNWSNKWMIIPYQGATRCLQGVHPSVSTGAIVELWLLSATSQQNRFPDSKMPIINTQVQDIPYQFLDIFEDPVGLPPSTMFTVCLYQYTPALKDHDTQAQELLTQLVIVSAYPNSPFTMQLVYGPSDLVRDGCFACNLGGRRSAEESLSISGRLGTSGVRRRGECQHQPFDRAGLAGCGTRAVER